MTLATEHPTPAAEARVAGPTAAPPLLIEYPRGSYMPERLYAFEVVLRDFLGLDYQARPWSGEDVRISLPRAEGKALRMPDVLFACPEASWLRPDSLPRRPLARWAPQEPAFAEFPPLPVLFGAERNGRHIDASDQELYLGLDVFGSAFFMLTRYEELVRPERDRHERFPASASLAFQEGFLERPIVNEYVEVLWRALQCLWPGLARPRREARLLLSHDVDRPLSVLGARLGRLLRAGLGDMVVRRDPQLALNRLLAAHPARADRQEDDPFYTFELIMGLSERHGLRSAFNFIADHPGGEIDGQYSLESPWIRRLMRRLHERGHEVGLHPSYHSFRDAAQLQLESKRLRAVMAAEGIRQPQLGGRQHYLRWENPTTWQLWADAGMAYDSTLGYPDHVGFRSGTCYEHAVFNLRTRQTLALRERPLIVMEGTLFSYMGLDFEASAARILQLYRTSRRFAGDFALLWHNSELISVHQKRCYRLVLDGLTRA